jgi:hypothetical protein
MKKFADRLLINVEHGADLKFYSQGGLYLAFGYLRVVIGQRGPYVEFSPNQIVWENFLIPENQKYRLNNAVVYYDEYRSKDPLFVKLYRQKRPVAYADYKVGLCYISPFDLLRDEMQPVIM